MAGVTFRYSEAFKRKVVDELESGKLRNLLEAREVYGIGGSRTVSRWVKKYGKNHLLGKVVKVETRGEREQLQVLKQRIRELEKALSDVTVREVLSRAYFEVLCEEMGVTDIEGFKKKLDAKRLPERWSSVRVGPT